MRTAVTDCHDRRRPRAKPPSERRARLRELRTWDHWLCHTAGLHDDPAPCRCRHRWTRERPTALYLGRPRTYESQKTPERELAEAESINTLRAFRPHVKALVCGGGHQEPPLPPPPHPGAEEERKPYFATSADVTAPATHPAEAEVQR